MIQQMPLLFLIYKKKWEDCLPVCWIRVPKPTSWNNMMTHCHPISPPLFFLLSKYTFTTLLNQRSNSLDSLPKE